MYAKIRQTAEHPAKMLFRKHNQHPVWRGWNMVQGNSAETQHPTTTTTTTGFLQSHPWLIMSCNPPCTVPKNYLNPPFKKLSLSRMEQAQFYTEIQIICWDSAGTQQSTFSILCIYRCCKNSKEYC